MIRGRRAGPRLAPASAGAAILFAIAAGSCAGGTGADPRAGSGAGPDTILATPAERRGREVYRRERCGRCHTLFRSPPGAGAWSPPEPFAARPGGSRVGPDLGAEGHRRSDDWQYAHLYAPASLVPGSRMPASRHLFSAGEDGRPVPSRDAIDLLAYLQALGRGRRDVWAESREAEPEIPAPPPADAALLRRGDDLYRRHCAFCHGDRGDGKGEAASLLLFPPRDFTRGLYRFRSTPLGSPPADADLFRSITLGTGTGSAMPRFAWLPGRDRWALVARIKEFSPRLRGSGPLAAPGPGRRSTGPRPGAGGRARLDVGRRLWDELGCAACHGGDGSGLTRGEAAASWIDLSGAPLPGSGDLTHACGLRGGASAEALERAVLRGVGSAMPAYEDALRGRAARRALIDYLLSIRGGP
ncbi:MAG: c-type cytochrome [Acidobacteriota bacterium]